MPDDAAAPQGRARRGFAMVREVDPRGMVTVRGDLASTAVTDAVGKVVGIEALGEGEARFTKGFGILWMSPDELLVFCPYGEAAHAVASLEAALEGSHALVADVSDARVGFTVCGEGAREVLAKLTPADVSPDRFHAGMVRRSRLAQIPAAFWMDDDDTVNIICFRSVAGYVSDLLSAATMPGSEVRYF